LIMITPEEDHSSLAECAIWADTLHLASSQSSQAVGILSGKDGVSMNFYDKDKLKEPNLSIVSNSGLKYKGLVI
jgi:hypothetical protein